MCLARADTCVAMDVPSDLSEFRITSWTGGDGVTLGAVKSISSGPNGYLWWHRRGACPLRRFPFHEDGHHHRQRQLPAAFADPCTYRAMAALWPGTTTGKASSTSFAAK